MKSLTFCVFVSLLGILNAKYPPFWAESHLVHSLGHGFGPYGSATFEVPCNNLITNEILFNFQRATYETLAILFRKIVALSDAHFAFSPYTIWKSLAAIAEGAEGNTREELFRLLSLPEDKCIRQLYYNIANREASSNDVVLDRKRVFFTDSSVILNRNWEISVKSQRLIDLASVPYKSNPSAEIESWKDTFDMQLPSINLNGNSLILESLDYNGLWNSAFSDSSIVKEPFYDRFGEQIATTLEYMKMRKRVKMGYLPSLNMKVLELPVGKDSRYIMLFGLALSQSGYRKSLDSVKSFSTFEAFRTLKKSLVPIDVVIPRLTITSEVDVRKVLEEIGISKLWVDPYATRNISGPAALPSSYIQRITVTLENSGVKPNSQEYSNFIPPFPNEGTPYSANATGLDPVLGNNFIANRPLLFGLFDSETYMCVFTSSFSKPT